MAADHVAQVELRELVVREVERGKARALEDVHELVGIVRVGRLDAHEDVGLGGVAHAVVEFGHVAVAHELAQTLEGAALLGNRHRKDRLALLAVLCALGHKAQTVEVHVGARGDGNERLVAHLLAAGPGLEARKRQRARGLDDGAGIFKDVLDGRADLVAVDKDDLVEILAAELERLVAHALDGGAVGEKAHVVQGDVFTRVDRALHGIRVLRLNADYLDLGVDRLDVGGYARGKSAAADLHEDRIRPRAVARLVLTQNFHADRALARDHVGIVKGVHEAQALFLLHLFGVRCGVREALAHENDLAAQVAHGLDLERGRRHGHHDHGAAAEAPGGKRHALGVVARRGADHAAGALLWREVHHLVEGAAQLEGEHGLLVLAL